jgi:hypothetical protein
MIVGVYLSRSAEEQRSAHKWKPVIVDLVSYNTALMPYDKLLTTKRGYANKSDSRPNCTKQFDWSWIVQSGIQPIVGVRLSV